MDDINELAERIKSLSDEEFERAIRSVGAALGADAATVEKLARDRKKIRRRLDGASRRDLEKAAAMLTPDQIEAVKKSVGGGR